MSRLPANQKHQPHHKRWKRYDSASGCRSVPDRPNHRWSLDFVSDQLWTVDGLALCVVDDCTKECLAIYADVSISGLRLSYLLEALSALRGYLREIVLDN